MSESAVAVSAIIGMFPLQRAHNSPILLNASLNGSLVGESERPQDLCFTLRELIFAVRSFEIFCGNLILRISHFKEN